MTDKPENPPAFPHTVRFIEDGVDQVDYGCGMRLRDYFAGQALAGLLSDPQFDVLPDKAAAGCYEYADAMLKARQS